MSAQVVIPDRYLSSYPFEDFFVSVLNDPSEYISTYSNRVISHVVYIIG